MQILEGSQPRIRLRPVRPEDCQLLWQDSNDPVVRAASFNSNPIPWEDHIKWFNSKLNNPDWYCFILYNEKSLTIGHVRFDTMGYEATIGITINSNFRGHGYSTEAIRLTSERLFQDTTVQRINAYIKPGNTISIKVFTKANYKIKGNKMQIQRIKPKTCSKCNEPFKEYRTPEERLLQTIFNDDLCERCYKTGEPKPCTTCKEHILAPIYYNNEPYHSKCLAEIFGQ